MFGIHAKMMCYSPIYGIYAADVPQKAGGCPTQHVYIFFLNNGYLSDRCSSRDVIYRLKPGISQVVPSPIIVRISGMGGGGPRTSDGVTAANASARENPYNEP